MCKGCGGNLMDTVWGPWCDVCGGVVLRPEKLIFRHVATVRGQGGVFAIVWDESASEYAYVHKDLNPPSNKVDIDGFKRPRVKMSHGTLDAMIALSYKDVIGDGSQQPELAPSPHVTEAEKALITSRMF